MRSGPAFTSGGRYLSTTQYGIATCWSRLAVITQLFCMVWYWPDRERRLDRREQRTSLTVVNRCVGDENGALAIRTLASPLPFRRRVGSGSAVMPVAAARHGRASPLYYLPKLATQLACSCGSLIGPHSLLMRLARKLPLACTTAS